MSRPLLKVTRATRWAIIADLASFFQPAQPCALAGQSDHDVKDDRPIFQKSRINFYDQWLTSWRVKEAW